MLQHPSALPKNCRFRNTNCHQLNLRSSQSAPNIIKNDDDSMNAIQEPQKFLLSTIPASSAQHPSILPKSCRFCNTNNHQCNLRLSQNHLPMHFINHIYNANGKRETIDSLITGSNKDIWTKSLSNDWGRLAQGNSLGIKGTHTQSNLFISIRFQKIAL